MSWSKSTAIPEVGEFCFERGNYVCGATKNGDYFDWKLFRRVNDGSLENSGAVWSHFGNPPDFQKGCNWADMYIAQKSL